MDKLINIYRKYMPMEIRASIADLRYRKKKKELLKKVVSTYRSNLYNVKFEEEYRFMSENNKFYTSPYPFVKNYIDKSIQVFKDKKKDMLYVMHKGKRLYFPKTFSEKWVKHYYNAVLCEQDIHSPHRYFTDKFEPLQDAIFFDIGSAEGLISLEYIDMIKKVLLFECDPLWVRALKATFEPWKEKVQIINKYVSDKDMKSMDNRAEVKLDTVIEKFDLKLKKKVVKIDVEGAEAAVLRGATSMLKEFDSYWAVCTYHKQNDEVILKDIFHDFDYKTEYSCGYMAMENLDSKEIQYRKGVICAWKSGGGGQKVLT